MDAQGITNTRLAKELGVTPQAVNHYLRSESMKLSTIEKICGCIGVSVSELFSQTEE
jgi:transcriptional regulator with XRE-family HTH domain